MAPVFMRECHIVMPKAYHKGMSFECSQTDGSRQYGPCPVRRVQPDRGALEHEREVARQSAQAVSRILNDMCNPSDIF